MITSPSAHSVSDEDYQPVDKHSGAARRELVVMETEGDRRGSELLPHLHPSGCEEKPPAFCSPPLSNRRSEEV